MGVMSATFNCKSQNGGAINTTTYSPCLKVTIDAMRQIAQVLMGNGQVIDVDISPATTFSGGTGSPSPTGPTYALNLK